MATAIEIVNKAAADTGGGEREQYIAKLEDEIERLRAALREYGDHTYECEMKERAGSCTCGYEAALA